MKNPAPDASAFVVVSDFCGKSMPQVSERRTLTWDALVAWLSSPRPSTDPKDELPLWSPAVFDGEGHGYRTLETVREVYALGFDVDVDPIPNADVLRAALAGHKAVAHTSSSSTADAPRWRAVVALSRPVTMTEYRRLHRALRVTFPFGVGTASDASRGWYVPRRGSDDSYQVIETHGSPVDVDATLASLPAEDGHAPAPVLPSTIDQMHPEFQERLDWFVDVCQTCAPPTTGGQTFAIAQKGTRSAELPADVVLAVLWGVLRPRCAEPVPPEEWWRVERVVERSITAGTFPIGTIGPELDWRRFVRRLGTTPANTTADASDTRPKRITPADRALRIGGKSLARIKTGWPSIDTATRGGVLLGKVVVIGGAPGAGKTALLVRHAYACLCAGIHVAILAADEDADALLIRLGQLQGLSRDALENGEPEARSALAAWCRSVPLILADGDEDDATIESVSRELRALAGGGPSVLLVDSIQTTRTETATPRDADARARINETVRALKRAAKVDGHQVWASSELSKAAYRNKAQAENTNPLAAFKESGDIEYGVSLAIVLVSHPGTNDIVDAAIVKNRLGPGKPEFALRLDYDRADVTEADISAVDPLHFKKAEIMDLLASGIPKTMNKIAESIGGNRPNALLAIRELVDANRLHQTKDGIRLPLPGEPGYAA